MSGFIVLISIIGVAFVTILIYEAVASYRRDIRIYTLADSLVNVYCGVMERSFDLFYAVLFLMASEYIYTNWAPFQIPSNLGTWLIGLVIFDFIAYWFHRLSHEINIFWAAHIVHHQSEELNFTTVFRVSFFAVMFRSLFFIWMPFAGFDAFSILTFGVFLAGYQFLTHSRMIGKLGILEKFMTTPSHHRVHHGRNAQYMDHNYGHVLIIWDKMFGTFVPEEEEPEYGITSGFESNSAMNAQVSYWKDLITRAKRASKISDKIKVFIKGPSWTPEDVGFLPSEFKTTAAGERIRRDVRITKEMSVYILSAAAITLLMFVRLVVLVKGMEVKSLSALIENQEVIFFTLFTIVSVYSQGLVLENSKNSFLTELVRLTGFVFLAFFFVENLNLGAWVVPTAMTYSVLHIIWIIRLNFFAGEQIRLVTGE